MASGAPMEDGHDKNVYREGFRAGLRRGLSRFKRRWPRAATWRHSIALALLSGQSLAAAGRSQIGMMRASRVSKLVMRDWPRVTFQGPRHREG
jgi:hypothetical protein